MKILRSMGLTYEFETNQLLVLDQTELPHLKKWIPCQNPDQMVELIQRLAIRGAPLLGVAAALSLANYAKNGANMDQIFLAAKKLRQARPTAINLMAAVDRLVFNNDPKMLNADFILRSASEIFHEDVRLCLRISELGAKKIEDGDTVLTHCNSGGLATAGIGTALGAIRRAHELGKRIHVFVNETRPLLQGARLTTWELKEAGIPHTLICDNMAGFLMSQKKVNKVMVGADRIAKNGDVANKIGTYSLAVLAKYHQLPFYVVAPRTTLDLKTATGKDIPVEERQAAEIFNHGFQNSPPTSLTWNPAFDITPHELITSLILDSNEDSGEKRENL